MRLAAWMVALLSCCVVPSAFACAGAVPVGVLFNQGSSLLAASERSSLEAAVRKARAAASHGQLQVALAIYSQDKEAGSKAELNRLTEQRVRSLREGFALLGLQPASVVAVLGDPSALPASAGEGGFAEVEIAYACGGS